MCISWDCWSNPLATGFEGAIAVHDLNNEMIILGLCEGNHCSESKKNDRGNGQIVAMRKDTKTENGDCVWKTIRIIDIPSSAYFKDYSALTMSATGRVGISSQEDSQFWVGQLLGQNEAGLWDINAMEFDPEKGTLLDFPKNDSCETVYCNVEGVHWLNDGKRYQCDQNKVVQIMLYTSGLSFLTVFGFVLLLGRHDYRRE